MSDMPWIRFFPSDWLAGTRGMSAAETGIYITLIATMYERGEPVPEDHSRLARLCGASNSVFKKALETLIEEGKIERVEGGIWNNRVGKENAFRAEKSELGARAASARWDKKPNKNKADTDAPALQQQSTSNANQKPDTRNHIAAAQLSPSAFLYDRLIEAASTRGPCHPTLALGIGQITDLIAQGYDLDRDILPIIREKARPDIGSWKFFATVIVQRAAERVAIPAKPQAAAIDWAARLKVFNESGVWGRWGPRPGESGCEVPADLIQQARAAA